jgi:hypothetical protein
MVCTPYYNTLYKSTLGGSERERYLALLAERRGSFLERASPAASPAGVDLAEAAEVVEPAVQVSSYVAAEAVAAAASQTTSAAPVEADSEDHSVSMAGVLRRPRQ